MSGERPSYHLDQEKLTVKKLAVFLKKKVPFRLPPINESQKMVPVHLPKTVHVQAQSGKVICKRELSGRRKATHFSNE